LPQSDEHNGMGEGFLKNPLRRRVQISAVIPPTFNRVPLGVRYCHRVQEHCAGRVNPRRIVGTRIVRVKVT